MELEKRIPKAPFPSNAIVKKLYRNSNESITFCDHRYSTITIKQTNQTFSTASWL